MLAARYTDGPTLSAPAMSIREVAGRLAIVVVLVLANAFFVAAEFALVAVRRSQIDQMASTGDKAARAVQGALRELDRYISATQLGITLASLGLGWIGEETIAALIDSSLRHFGVSIPPAATHTTAAAITAFIIITVLHIVLGELAPKSVALWAPERVSKAAARPLVAFATVMAPAIALLNGASRGMLHLVGIHTVDEGDRAHTPEELRLLVMQARARGALAESDSAMLAGVFDFHAKRVRDVMRPRTSVVALPVEATEEEVWVTLREERYSRYPVFRESLDDVVGVFLAKDLWLKPPDEPFALERMMRPPLYVPDSRSADRVLDDLRRTRAHMAVVLDEYGGTAGIVTLEDLVEEVVGDINDEYDVALRAAVETNGVLELAGDMSLVDVRSDYNLPIPPGAWTTLGGYAFARLGRLPKMGDRAPFPGGELEIVAMDGRRVAALRVHRAAAAPTGVSR